VIDLEVEHKRVMVDVQRVIDLREREVRIANEKTEDMNIELRQIEQ
jgi:hypothetical protein